jgi:hypothetical protein
MRRWKRLGISEVVGNQSIPTDIHVRVDTDKKTAVDERGRTSFREVLVGDNSVTLCHWNCDETASLAFSNTYLTITIDLNTGGLSGEGGAGKEGVDYESASALHGECEARWIPQD